MTRPLAVTLALAVTVTVAVAVALAVTLALAPTVAAGASTSRLPVLGFQSETDPPALIDGSAQAMTIVGVDGIALNGPGTVVTPDQQALAQLARAHADHLPAVLLVSNWSDRLNNMSERLAYETLRNPALVQRAAAAVAQDVESEGWNGVSVDLESLRSRDGAGLARFLADLHDDLPRADSLTACLQAATSPAGYRADGYELQALSASVSQFVLMTYDDHGPWENTPGPIGPLHWQRAAVRALERLVSRHQIYLGAANYGYGWRPHHHNVNLNVAQARALVAHWRAHARWVGAVGEWTATLRDGSTLWWSDARSVALRIGLARELGLHGVAVWSLGTGDPLPT